VKNNIRHFGLFVYLGIELRNFIFSDLSSSLAEFSQVSVITHQTAEILKAELEKRKINLIKIHDKRIISKSRRKLESYFLSTRRARLRLKGHEVFNLWKVSTSKRTKDYFIGNTLVYKLMQYLSFIDNKKYYYDNNIAELIITNKITDIIIQGYFTPENMTIAITAKKLGCKVWVINWSWKDVFINEYIPFTPNGFFTWSENLKSLYQEFNSQIHPDIIKVIGNISYDRMFNYKPVKPVSYYAKKYNFDSNLPIIIYTMVHPNIFGNEHLIVKEIADNLSKECCNFVILMKPNPMDNDWSRFKKVEINNKLITLENLWYYDKESDFNMITEEGQTEWLDLIYYSCANLSVASTVTIEYLIMRRPVLNVLFDEHNNLQNEFLRLFNSPFYQITHKREDVIGCKSIEDVSSGLLNLDKITNTGQNINELIAGKGDSLEKFLKIVKNND
jgi:hypothetical protein